MGYGEKIIFFDLDGVASTSLTVLAYGDIIALDSVTMQCLNSICETTDAKLVLTSTRSLMDCPPLYQENVRLLGEAGFDIANLHQEWSCRFDHESSREEHISVFLKNHPEVTHYAIVDDEHVDLPNFIQVSEYDGLLHEHFEKIAEYLDFKLHLAFNTARTKHFGHTDQLRLPLDAFDDQINTNILTRNEI